MSRPLDEFSATRIRLLFAELDAIDPQEAERIVTDPVRGPLLKQAHEFPHRRRWQCPQCFTVTYSTQPPAGWLVITEGIPRALACSLCQEHPTMTYIEQLHG